MTLAQWAALGDLAEDHVRIVRPREVKAHLKLACLVAGMIASADSIYNVNLLRHGALPGVFGGIRVVHRVRSCARSARSRSRARGRKIERLLSPA
jgi:hypothetical protein